MTLPTSDPTNEIIAYPVAPRVPPLVVAPKTREWMDNVPDKFIYFCTPLVIGNQMGWQMLNPSTFTAIWNGSAGIHDVYVDGYSPMAEAHFGNGILTFNVNYVFRTPPETNLMIQGPSNLFKDGIQPMTAVVETDWLPYTFTMNWKFTRPEHPVTFLEGEPFCQFFPYPRSYIETYEPALEKIPVSIDVERAVWARAREHYEVARQNPAQPEHRLKWAKNYAKGITARGTKAPDSHQKTLELKPFKELT